MSEAPRIMATEGIQISDLTDEFQEKVLQEVRSYAVGLALEIHLPKKGGGDEEDCKLIGSGTLVQWARDKYGILTAEHVPSFPESSTLRLDTSLASKQRLRILFVDRVNTFGFEAKALTVHSLGKSVGKAMGPDIAVIQLPPCDELGTLIAKKSFWHLTNKRDEKLAAAMNTIGCMAIAGHPGEDIQEDVGPAGGFKEVTFSPGFMGLTGQTEYFECGELAYLGVTSKRTNENGAPTSYRGVSGGSLWRVPILRNLKDDPNDKSKLFPGRPTLAGVPFWQFPEEDGIIQVRGHGPKTIYKALVEKLMLEPSEEASK